jgi:membrane protein implicated in regulation of membrane protease activity
MLASILERSLIALGRHATAFDGVYWIYALVAVVVGVGLSLLTGLWGLAGLTLAFFAGIAILARRRYEKSLGS